MELNPILNLDIGGQKFRVLRETVLKHPRSLLAQVITGKDTYHMLVIENSYFFDRNPQYFAVILDFLRIGKIFLPPNLLKDQLEEELKFWKIEPGPQISNLPTQVNEIDPTLVIAEKFDPTLIIPTDYQSTVITSTLIEPTVLINSPKIEPTLLIQEPPQYFLNHDQEKKQENLKNSIKSLRAVADAENEAKKESQKIIEEDDELLKSLIPDNNPSQGSRTLPWANKVKGKTAEKIETKLTKSVEERKNKILLKNKNTKKEEESVDEAGYESSFIDDDGLSISSHEFKPNKRKKSKAPEPVKLLKSNASNKCKKTVIPDVQTLSNALKNIR